METHSLYDLNEYISRVIALNFREPIWIKAEASQIKPSRNNFYLDLVEKKKDSDDIIAQANAVLWARNYFFLKKKLGDVLDEILVDGSEILIKVKVDFNERYGMKLQIEDIDASYTLGQAQLRRQEIIDRIKKEGLHELNEQIPLPPVIQSIAVLSSATAAGYKDFVNQIETNSYGYKFDIELYPIAVQGSQLESQLVNALTRIEDSDKYYDCIVITRGGGSKLDLSWFDTYKIASKIANAPFPVLTGIGHEIDYSIADMAAHTDVKTPTAVADFILEHNLQYESYMIDMANKISAKTIEIISGKEILLERIMLNIVSHSSQTISHSDYMLEHIEQNIFASSESLISSNVTNIESKEKLINSLEPKSVLRRGYAVLYKGKTSLHSQKDIAIGDKFDVELVDGRFASERLK